EHIGERHHRMDHLRDTALLSAIDLTTAAIQVTDHVTHIFFRRHNPDLHDRLEELHPRLLRTFTEGSARGDFEGHHAGVNVMVGTIDQRRFEVDHREAGERTRVLHALDTLLHARHIFLRHRTANDLAFEDETRTRLARLENELHACELARTARLLLVRVIDFRALRERLAIGHLRRTHIRVHLELAAHAIDDDVEMQFAHALNDGLAGFIIHRHAEGRIFLREAIEREAHLLLVSLRLRLNS